MMNTFDLYGFEFDKPPTPVPPANGPNQAPSSSSSPAEAVAVGPTSPTLNEEVNQAIGQLSKFWGGFRASSQSAFQLARKDFGQVVEQARAEIGKLSSDTSVARSPTASSSQSGPAAPMDIDSTPDPDVADKGKNKDPSEFPGSSPPPSPSISTSIYARLQSHMPPNLQPSAIAATLSSATSAASTVDLANIRSTLAVNIQRAQDNLPLAQAEKLAEGYLHRSQELFKEAGEFLKDAVKVVPPAIGPDGKPILEDTIPIVSGTDVWLFPSPIGTTGWGGPIATEREASATPPLKELRASLKSRESTFTGHMSQATRSEALSRRLKHDPEMIRLDPAQDDAVKAEFVAFAQHVDSKLGGITGDTMVTRISDVLKAGPEGELDADAKALIDVRDLLVPNEMSNDVFWTRYFFRVQQITDEEEKRKALLANVSQGEEVFSWEDDEDEAPPSRPGSAAATITAARLGPSPASPESPPPRILSNPTIQSIASTASSRISSEDGSYDIVGEESAAGTRGQSPVSGPPVPITTVPMKRHTKGDDDNNSDSDWE